MPPPDVGTVWVWPGGAGAAVAGAAAGAGGAGAAASGWAAGACAGVGATVVVGAGGAVVVVAGGGWFRRPAAPADRRSLGWRHGSAERGGEARLDSRPARCLRRPRSRYRRLPPLCPQRKADPHRGPVRRVDNVLVPDHEHDRNDRGRRTHLRGW